MLASQIQKLLRQTLVCSSQRTRISGLGAKCNDGNKPKGTTGAPGQRVTLEGKEALGNGGKFLSEEARQTATEDHKHCGLLEPEVCGGTWDRR